MSGFLLVPTHRMQYLHSQAFQNSDFIRTLSLQELWYALREKGAGWSGKTKLQKLRWRRAKRQFVFLLTQSIMKRNPDPCLMLDDPVRPLHAPGLPGTNSQGFLLPLQLAFRVLCLRLFLPDFWKAGNAQWKDPFSFLLL